MPTPPFVFDVLRDYALEALKGVREDIGLPDDLREKAEKWPAYVTQQLGLAVIAHTAGNTAGYDAAIREVQLIAQAAKTVANATLLAGLAAGERQARETLSRVTDFVIGFGLKALAAAL